MSNEKPEGSIMIVDDNADNLRLLTVILKHVGYRLRPLRDAALLLPSAAANPPDVILLDVRMGKENGFEVSRLLKADERTKHIPIIFLCDMVDRADREKAFSAGGMAYISKPFLPEEVLARVSSLLPKDRPKSDPDLKQEKRRIESGVND